MDVPDYERASDARLTIAASHGDDDAFAVLYVRYAPRIGAYLNRLVGDEHLAEDLTHEVFVSALRRLRTDRPPIAVGAWLYRIARNASIDVHRRSQLIREVPLPAPGDETAALAGQLDPVAEAELRQRLDDLRDLLGSLSETHRVVLVLRELEGLSNAEIGERLGVSRPAVEGLLFRARAKVRSEYEELVSGRRCAKVQAALDRAAAGRRLGRRDLDLASRHMRACAQCRRHAWEQGVSSVPDAGAPKGRRGVLLPAPLLHLLTRVAAEPQALLGAGWGRAAVAAAAVAVTGAVVAPRVEHAAPAAASAPIAIAIARTATAAPTGSGEVGPRPPARSSAAVVTALPEAVEAVPPTAAVSDAAPEAGPATSPASGPEPSAQPERGTASAPGPERPDVVPAPRRDISAPKRPAPPRPEPEAAAARSREVVVAETAPVAEAAPDPLAQAAAGAAGTLGEGVADVLAPLPLPPPPAAGLFATAPLGGDALAALTVPVAAPALEGTPAVVPAGA